MYYFRLFLFEYMFFRWNYEWLFSIYVLRLIICLITIIFFFFTSTDVRLFFFVEHSDAKIRRCNINLANLYPSENIFSEMKFVCFSLLGMSPRQERHATGSLPIKACRCWDHRHSACARSWVTWSDEQLLTLCFAVAGRRLVIKICR